MNRLAESAHWPACQVTLRPIAELKDAARNARKHSEKQIDQLRGLLRDYGWTMPVLVDEEGRLIAGHGRVEAARREGIAEVPVAVAAGWTETQRRAYALADNKVALNSTWDEAALGLELGELSGLGVDLGTLGFEDSEIAAVSGTGGHTGLIDPDEAPQPAADPISTRGDLWALGRHRLLCGNSTNPDDVKRVLGDVAPHLMVTDPPYGVEYDPNWRNSAKRADGTVIGAAAVGQVLNDGNADWREAWALFPGDVAYVWHAGLFAGVVAESLQASGFGLRSQIIWAKSNFAIGRGNYHWQHEPCWYAVREKRKGHWVGDRKQATLWEIPKPAASETGHGTQKPVECMKRPIENNSSPGQAIYEPFNGSGTTIIAAEITGRACHAVELNPAYVDVAVKRWQDFTGQKATLEGDGRTFDEIAAERLQRAA